tara:strand:- start:4001 stop:4165 length:165 start_codon:yes stop_codon:yes gene_type:complete
MYRNKAKQKKSTKAQVFEHDIVPASKKEKVPKVKDIFEISNKDKKKVKKKISKY